MKEIYSWTEPNVPMSPATFIVQAHETIDGKAIALDVTARGTINARGEMGQQGNLMVPLAEAYKLWRALGEFIAIERLKG